MTMRRSASLLALFAITLTSCFDQGANDEDQQRLDRLIEDPIVTAVVANVEEKREMSTQLAESSSAVLDGPETANVVRLAYQFTEPPTDVDLQAAAWAYADALLSAGWSNVNARCQDQPEGSTSVRVTSARDDRGYIETGSVAFEPDESRWNIVIFLTAPRHTDSGGSVSGDSNLDCINEAHVE